MLTIPIKASKSYNVHIGTGIGLSDALMADMVKDRRVVIVSDSNVFKLYGEKIKNLFNPEKLMCFVFPAGEESKNLTTYTNLLEEMCENNITRTDIVLALGGGVTGDLAGYAAATYQRGIDFIQMPTSLLAAVDSSVGGKTGLDLSHGKNQVGVFYQPVMVICDIDFLKTLPKEEYENGCAEIIKYAMIRQGLYEDICQKNVSEQYENVIGKCISIKRDFVEEDEFDNGQRMKLNFGHTIGHAIENCSHYSIGHGRAVAIGMAVITKAAVCKGYCDESVYSKLVDLLQKYNLPYETEYAADELINVIMTDKKSQGDYINLVVPRKIGECELVKCRKDNVGSWLECGLAKG